MYYDRATAEMERNQKESYDKLKAFIKTQEGNEFLLASFHIQSMENEMERMKNKLEEYNRFFATLHHFLPRQSSIHDVIG